MPISLALRTRALGRLSAGIALLALGLFLLFTPARKDRSGGSILPASSFGGSASDSSAQLLQPRHSSVVPTPSSRSLVVSGLSESTSAAQTSEGLNLQLRPLTDQDKITLARGGVRITGSSGAVVAGAAPPTDFQTGDMLLGPCFRKTVLLYRELIQETARLEPSQHWCYRVFRNRGVTFVAGGS